MSQRIKATNRLALICALLVALLYVEAPPASAGMSCFGATPTVVGSEDADHLEGTHGDDVIVGLGGHDRIEGLSGDDLICGGGGRDSIRAGTGDDRVDGGQGRDFLSGEGGADRLEGGPSNDFVSGDQGPDDLAGGPGDDSLDGDSGADLLDGEDGDDRISGGDGLDSLEGGAGSDHLSGGRHDDEISGGAGDDVLSFTRVRPEEEDPSTDDGNDLYSGGPGVDLIDGSGATSPLRISLAEARIQGYGLDSLRGIERVHGSHLDDVIDGDGQDNELRGGSGNDQIRGFEGDDVLAGDQGDDGLDGGPGVDLASFDGNGRRLVVNLAGRAATGQGDDSLLDIEDVLGGRRNDVIIGDDSDNRLHGGPGGKDSLRGLSGNDHLIGGSDEVDRNGRPFDLSEDILYGGPGDDILDGAFGDDTADFATASAGVTADLTTGLADGEGSDRLLGIEDLSGSGYDDVLIGDDRPVDPETGLGGNEITGRAGNDSMQALGGADLLIGGTGDDAYDGGEGLDAIDFGRSRTEITADLQLGTISGEGADTVTGIENLFGSTRPDTFIGDDADNHFIGRTNDDVLRGGGGNDTLDGLKGEDQIEGGDGDDLILDGDHADTVMGGAGDDVFRTGTGDDAFDGGEGVDTLDFSLSERGMTVDLVAGTTSTFGDQGSDTVTNVEDLWGTIETDEFTGDGADNSFIGFGGADELFGGDGDDTLEGLGGADIMDGGEGSDTLTYHQARRPVTVDLGAAFASGHGADTVLSIENLVGSIWPDIFRGNELANRFFGGEGGDILEGLSGDDYLDGQEGFDTVDGGEGTDTCFGESRLGCEV